MRPLDPLTILKIAGLGPGNVPIPQIIPISDVGAVRPLVGGRGEGVVGSGGIVGGSGGIVGGGGTPLIELPGPPAPRQPTILDALGADYPVGGSWTGDFQPPPPAIESPGFEFTEKPGEYSPLQNLIIGGTGAAATFGEEVLRQALEGPQALKDLKSFVFDPSDPENSLKLADDKTEVTADPAVVTPNLINPNVLLGGGGATGGKGGTFDLNLGKVPIPGPPPTINPLIFPMPPGLELPQARPTRDAPIVTSNMETDLPDPAARPLREAIDWAPYLERMKEYEPKDLNRKEYMKERLLGNLSRALAAGAGGSGWSGAGGAVARAGGAFGEGTAKMGEQFLEEQLQIDEQQREFGVNQLGLEMRLRQEAADLAAQNANTQWQSGEDVRGVKTQELQLRNQKSDLERQLQDRAAEVQFQNEQTGWQSGEDVRQTKSTQTAQEYEVIAKNAQLAHEANQQQADRMWDYNKSLTEMHQPKVLPGTGKDTMAIQQVDPETGELKIKIYNYDDPYNGFSDESMDSLNKLNDQGLGDTAAAKSIIYNGLLSTNDMIGVNREIVREAYDGQYLEKLIPLEQLEELQERISKKVQQSGLIPGNDEYDRKVISGVVTEAAALLNISNLTNEQIVELANLGNYGIRLFLSKSMKERAAHPELAQPGVQ